MDVKAQLIRKILLTSHVPGISGFDYPLFDARRCDWYLMLSPFS